MVAVAHNRKYFNSLATMKKEVHKRLRTINLPRCFPGTRYTIW